MTPPRAIKAIAMMTPKKSKEYYSGSGSSLSFWEMAKLRAKNKAEMKKCPKCGNKLARIVYGEPTLEAVEAIKRKELYPGGCMVFPGAPNYHCYHCELEFDNNLRELTWLDALRNSSRESNE